MRTIEVCVETIEEAIEAQKRGANRIEFCSSLDVGGLTPSYENIIAIKEHTNLPIMVMIRPRKGNFVYSQEEFLQMKKDIAFCKEKGIEGVVFGILTSDGTIDLGRTRELTNLSFPMQVTFHKAFDIVKNPMQELSNLIGIKGVTSLLTSGTKETALKGEKVLNDMLKIANNKIKIIVAGRVTNKNIKEVSSKISAQEFHGRKILGRLF